MSPFSNERSNNLLIFLNVGIIIQSDLLFLGCVVISDLYLFQETVLLNACFKSSKNYVNVYRQIDNLKIYESILKFMNLY